ncbi:MAG TPA: N-acetylmuramoyl-L-alanine amidase [Pseudobacteroides sp.]|uniref:N-acetylmuramoyl-L-alanine amidase family protein n=1 Tax=Pseudobacteroides sp. TaxID=1968840 RepID=UPI002F95A8E4
MSEISNRKYFFIIIINLFTLLFWASTSAEAHAVQSKKIVIDPGHGGVDSGCIRKDLHEKDITLDISEKVKSILQNKGFNVDLTRKSDESLYNYCKIGDTLERRDLNARVNRINDSNADIFVSIHVNSYFNPEINGSTAFYFSEQCLKSKALAKSIQRSLNNLVIEGNKRMAHNSRAEDYYILKNTTIPGVLVETGFITNPRERGLLSTNSYRQKLAKSIASGIAEYMKSQG